MRNKQESFFFFYQVCMKYATILSNWSYFSVYGSPHKPSDYKVPPKFLDLTRVLLPM